MRADIKGQWAGALCAAIIAGCVGGEGTPTGTTVLEVTNIPSGVLCLRFNVQSPGAAAVVLDRTVTGGSAARVDLGALPGGDTVLSAQAFTAACGVVTPSSTPAWIAAAQTWPIRAGYVNEIDLVFRPNTQVIVRGDFAVPARAITMSSTTAYALLQDGTLRAWGYGAWGQLGDGSFASSALPVTVSLTGVTRVAAGSVHACALREDGEAYCWGYNGRGHVGNGVVGNVGTPTPVSAGGRRFSDIGVGNEHSCALDGTQIWCWGAQPPFGGVGDALVPTVAPVTGSFAAYGIFIGGYGTCARNASARLSCVGTNLNAELGLAIGAVTSLTQNQFPIMNTYDLGELHSCAVTLAGSVRCAGSNSHGQLGNGTSGAYVEANPVAVSITNVVAVGVGYQHSCALKGDGTVWCWGRGDQGAIGSVVGAGVLRVTTPQQVAGLTDVVQIASGTVSTCALRREGTVWCWGYNANGQIGDGTGVTRYTPVRVTL